ncbi:hypothetical protein V6N12_075831 [Hibiscus sabdariffa]|uniref:Secreted protein n=1 Tax=Hibiscus sabdariffa TaxID=183260 RepID=A0ABR2BEE1_9ROSI
MLFSLSWRWLRWWCVCYAWCMLRAPFGAALRSGAIRGGASFVRLASCLRDCFGSPRLEPEFLPLHLGFHFATKGYPIGDLGLGHPWRSLSTLRGPWLGMALSIRGLFPASASLHARCIGPLGLVRCYAFAQPSRQAPGCARIAAHCETPKVPFHRGQGARLIGWLRALLRPFRSLRVSSWLGIQVTLGPVSMGHCLVPQASLFWPL